MVKSSAWLLSPVEMVRYRCGEVKIPAIVEALHAKPPSNDYFTGSIAEQIGSLSGASVILGNVSRDIVDLNRPVGSSCPVEARVDYECAMGDILKNVGFSPGNNLLLLSVHGCTDSWGGKYSFYVGTHHRRSCCEKVQNWFMQYLTSEVPGQFGIPLHQFEIGDDNPRFSGLPNLELFTEKYGANFSTIQLEISYTIRHEYRTQLVGLLSGALIKFSETFG